MFAGGTDKDDVAPGGHPLFDLIIAPSAFLAKVSFHSQSLEIGGGR
jgi:hypothetical protein